MATVVRYKAAMPTPDNEAHVQLATRIPHSLRRQMKLHCVSADTTVIQFVQDAIEEKLAREKGKRRKRA